MMKTILTYGFSIFFAAYFSMAGLGHNVVHYCCSECEKAGIEHVLSTSCESLHHEQEEQHHHDCTCSSSSENTCDTNVNNPVVDTCGLLRLVVDTPSAAKFEKTVVAQLLTSLMPILFDSCQPETVACSDKEIPVPPDSPLFRGRDILIRHAVLRI
ncbi:MAG: hypothetical protein LBH80_06225 [Prevotellaceae bacterium]|jgi:hypothetical protein|nr:hypothetical protein [Prevotellaceae bacterium]